MLLGMQNRTAILEVSLAISHKTKYSLSKSRLTVFLYGKVIQLIAYNKELKNKKLLHKRNCEHNESTTEVMIVIMIKK